MLKDADQSPLSQELENKIALLGLRQASIIVRVCNSKSLFQWKV